MNLRGGCAASRQPDALAPLTRPSLPCCKDAPGRSLLSLVLQQQREERAQPCPAPHRLRLMFLLSFPARRCSVPGGWDPRKQEESSWFPCTDKSSLALPATPILTFRAEMEEQY